MAELGSDENLNATTASIDQVKTYQASMAKIRLSSDREDQS